MLKTKTFIFFASALVLFLGCYYLLSAEKIEKSKNPDVADGIAKNVSQAVATLDQKAAPIKEELASYQFNFSSEQKGIAEIEKEISGLFFIENQFDQKVSVEGDFYHFDYQGFIEPKIVWHQALDENGNNILRAYSDEELAERERFNTANRYYEGSWYDDFYISSTDKVVSANGICKLEFPSEITEISVSNNQVGELIIKEDIAVKVSKMQSGSVDVSYYLPERLKQGGYFGRDSHQAKLINGLSEPAYFRSKNMSISGVPQSVQLYIVKSTVDLQVPITAWSKPEVNFGEISSPIRGTRLQKAKEFLEYENTDFHTLQQSIKPVFKQTKNWQGGLNQSLQLIMPKNANSTFASVDFSQLNAFLDGQAVEFKVAKVHSPSNVYSTEFQSPEQNNFSYVQVDAVSGNVSVKYPNNLEWVTLNQGQTIEGVTLSGNTVRYPKEGGVPYYSFVWDTRSINAFNAKGQPIRYFSDSNFSNNKQFYEVVFWGEPAYVDVLFVRDWFQFDLPIDVAKQDLVKQK